MSYAYYRRPIKLDEYGLKRIPDYTELAYKEAVSKLRYFLSGNYAPSVRSYGSPSIKIVEESDCEDRKYSPGANALAEFRPRPKLTAKYATLYADSLNYAHTPNVSVPAAQGGSTAKEVSSTSPDVVTFIQKQEEYIEQLERESQYCRDELNNLLGKVKEVISENEQLHEVQKSRLLARMFRAGSDTDDLDETPDGGPLDGGHQIPPPKSRRSAKSRSEGRKLEGPNIVFESRIAELEAQLAQAKIDLKKVQEENNENKRKIASGLVDSTCLDGFKRQIDNLQRDKNALEAQISKLKLSLEHRDGDDKYSRGTDIVAAQLREERNSLEAEVLRLKEDLARERSQVCKLAGEGARRAIQERSAAEQRHSAHSEELQRDLAAQYDAVAKLQLELDRQRREENDLKRELSLKNSAIEELKTEFKNKSGSLQADLAQAYAEKVSVEEELASARLAIERLQRQAKHEANRLNSEIQSLRQRLDRADADLVHSRRENLRLSEQISNLEKEINMKTLTPSTPPEKNKDKDHLSSILESMENKHTKTVAELESMIQSQNSLMEKLTGECRLLTDKLDDANRRHKQSAETQPYRRTNQNTARSVKIQRPINSKPPFEAPLRKRVREELAALHRQVNSLGKSMQPTQHAPSSYAAPATHTTAANRRLPAPLAGAGPVYPGPDATRHPQIRRPSVAGFQPDRDDRPASRAVSRQSSVKSIRSDALTNNTQQYQYLDDAVGNQHTSSESRKEEEVPNAEQEDQNQYYKLQQYDQSYAKSADDQTPQKYKQEHNEYGEGPIEQYQEITPENDAQYEQSQITDDTGYDTGVTSSVPYQQTDNTNYENNVSDTTNAQYGHSDETNGAQYDHTSTAYDQSDPNYQGYDPQQYDQSYPQEYENYDQYQQQYVDPNAQYQDHSESQFQGDQYNTEYQQPRPQPQTFETKSAAEYTDSKRSNSPNDKAQS